jgi:hypothetical protein
MYQCVNHCISESKRLGVSVATITFKAPPSDWGTVKWRVSPGAGWQILGDDGVWRAPEPSEWEVDVVVSLDGASDEVSDD